MSAGASSTTTQRRRDAQRLGSEQKERGVRLAARCLPPAQFSIEQRQQREPIWQIHLAQHGRDILR
jgi:hypothetical protein